MGTREAAIPLTPPATVLALPFRSKCPFHCGVGPKSGSCQARGLRNEGRTFTAKSEVGMGAKVLSFAVEGVGLA
jgi:hypothetical protein